MEKIRKQFCLREKSIAAPSVGEKIRFGLK